MEEGRYKAIAKDGNSSFETVMKIVGAFGLRMASSAARARNPDRVSPCLRAWASIARKMRRGKVMLILAALSPSSLASTSTTAQVQPR